MAYNITLVSNAQQWFNIYILYYVITIPSITTCHHAKLLWYYWLYSLCCTSVNEWIKKSLVWVFFNRQLRTCLLILDRRDGREIERGREKHRLVASSMCLIRNQTWNRTHNLGLCTDQQLNPGSCDLRHNAPTTWAMPARAPCIFFNE